MSNLMAVLLQTLSARLGVVTGHDLAQACRAEYSPVVNVVLWMAAEVAIAATDLAEILGTIIALKLLFGLPLLWGCLVTAFDTFLLLYLQRWGMRQMEAVVLALVATIGACFLIQIFMARPDWGGVVLGLGPTLADRRRFYVAIGILGATVMPHNLYLHSALVQSRQIGADRASKKVACRYYLVDSAIALNLAFFVNAAILILARRSSIARRGGRQHRGSAQAAARVPRRPPRSCSHRPVVRRAQFDADRHAGRPDRDGGLPAPADRPLAAPAGDAAAGPGPGRAGDPDGRESGQPRPAGPQSGDPEPAALVRGDPADPLHPNRRNMGDSRRPGGQVLAWTTAAIIVVLNAKLVLGQDRRVVDWRPNRGFGRADPARVARGRRALRRLGGGRDAAVWVTIKPIVRLAPWRPKPSVELDWMEALRPRPWRRIGVALEHDHADAEILNRALGLAQTQPEPSEIVLLHVVDTAMTRVLGPRRPTRRPAPTSVSRGLGRRPRGRGHPRAPSCSTAPIRPVSWSPTPPRFGRPTCRRLARPRHGPRPAPGPDGRPGPSSPRRAERLIARPGRGARRCAVSLPSPGPQHDEDGVATNMLA